MGTKRSVLKRAEYAGTLRRLVEEGLIYKDEAEKYEAINWLILTDGLKRLYKINLQLMIIMCKEIDSWLKRMLELEEAGYLDNEDTLLIDKDELLDLIGAYVDQYGGEEYV